MITASHNPVADNGVKMVEPDGGMLPQAFEPVATELANCQTDDDVVAVLRDMVLGQAQQASGARRENLTVLVGHDTRPSAPQLLEAALAGIRALGVHAHSCGCVTTPQLHFLVYESNHGAAASSSEGPAAPPLQSYYDTILGAFLELASPTTSTTSTASTSESAPMVVYVDCANGVGAAQLKPVAEALAGRGIELRLRNTGAGGGQLNHRCGADFVQKDRLPPTEWEDVPDGARCCSVDGDADRLVYFSPQPPAEAAEAAEAKDGGSAAAARGIALWDGDKVAMLAAVFIRDLMAQLPAGLMDGVRVCCVQTAYANGASTAYLRDVLQLPTVCTPTGVKYLHEAAHDADLGIYFESNGHGTVLFSKGLRERLQAAGEHPAAKELLLLSRLINQTVGDAISGLLLVELILRRKAWTLAEWQALYTDLPSRQLKLKVADRAAITTTDAERSCVTPPGLQAAIDEAVAKVPQGRAFARPSGTEDAVRIYAEAATQQEADELARTVAQLVYDKAGGVGPRP
ncbi:hypothetical protein HYH03_011617 [Edaphochlamys debaryana]|uniref:phosphoacetylglucosamine mutase n=1 Tax=Edaphochlamys debaryana TaxID=47281 RepID=A0A836BWB9_9CHLO|nr:hypothetical protein HYH03_011617 [Edaphochlamys debaryana]|eukprot:KAG2489988.1 hypothetical protein HYH03_011617 [Edaphochlamys debaryana]